MTGAFEQGKPDKAAGSLYILCQFPGHAMTESTMTESLENRRKRLRFRSWHRGTQEMDLLIGSFADAHLNSFDAAQLGRFEALLDVPEPVVYDWILGRSQPPAEFDHDVLRLLLDFEYKPPTR